ncbi:hypothetical protein AMJ86_00745 [bacterium SM23_57]|nr:MAG: hypothetical protein AMJ86_00745 [bacterium SM23_57]
METLNEFHLREIAGKILQEISPLDPDTELIPFQIIDHKCIDRILNYDGHVVIRYDERYTRFSEPREYDTRLCEFWITFFNDEGDMIPMKYDEDYLEEMMKRKIND